MKPTAIENKDIEATRPFYNSFIPNDWNIPEFGSVFSFMKTFSFSREYLTNEKTVDEIRNIHYGDIHATYENEILDLEVEKTIPYLRDGVVNSDRFFEDEGFPALKDGDLIIADASEDYEGVCNCVELKNVRCNKVIAGLHTFAARTTEDKIALGFRTYILNHQQIIRELRRIATGISVYGVSKTNLSSVKIALPPLSEQKVIANILSTWDKSIQKNEQLIVQKELNKKWLMQQLLTGKKRVKGFERKWKTNSLKQFIKLTLREVEKPLTPYLALGIRSHGKGTFLKHNEMPEKNSMDKLYTVRKDDLIVNITFAWEMAIAIVGAKDDGALVSHRFPTYTFIQNQGHPNFFRFFILQPKMKYMLDQISPGGAGRNRVMSKSDFLKLDFMLPDYEEQIAIAQVLQTADDEIQLLKAKKEKLREQKKGLMQQLLTGKIRIK